MMLLEWVLVIVFVLPMIGALLFMAAVIIKSQIQEEVKKDAEACQLHA